MRLNITYTDRIWTKKEPRSIMEINVGSDDLTNLLMMCLTTMVILVNDLIFIGGSIVRSRMPSSQTGL